MGVRDQGCGVRRGLRVGLVPHCLHAVSFYFPERVEPHSHLTTYACTFHF